MASGTFHFGTLLRGRYSPLFFILPVLLVTAYVYQVSRAVWQTRLSGQQPAIRLSVHRGLSKLVLVSEEDGEHIEFAVADSLAGVQAFWLGLREKGAAVPSSPLWRECPRAPGAADKGPHRSEELRLTLDAQAVGSLRCEFDSEADLSKPPVKEPNYRPKTKTRKLVLWINAEQTPSTYREVWLIPYVRSQVTQSWKVLHPVSVLHWMGAEWQLGRDEKEQGKGPLEQGKVLAEECSGQDKPAQGQCLFAETLLNQPDLVLLRDPQQAAVAAAHWMELRAVPIIVGVMVCTNVVLFALLVGIGVWWLLGSFISEKRPRLSAVVQESFDAGVPDNGEARKRRSGRSPLLIPLASVDRGLRRLLEWLEVTGPALGFMLTVCALLLAFDPRTFVERDMNRFATAISMAMSATFAGLGIRLLAFTIDRMLEHVLRRGGKDFKVDLMDNVYTFSDSQPPPPAPPQDGVQVSVEQPPVAAQPRTPVSPAPPTHLPITPVAPPPPAAEEVGASAPRGRVKP